MSLKNDSIDLSNLVPQLVLAYWFCCEVYKEYGVDCVITSGNDDTHMVGSRHYDGAAFDLRTRDFSSQTDKQAARDAIKKKLNKDFDVILESNHLHLEYHRKGR